MPLMAGAQNLKTTTSVVNLGAVMYEQPATATFTVTNTSSNPLTITSVDTGCGCTTASFPKNPIAPGKKGKITLTFDARQLGHFEKPSLVFNNSEEKPIELTIKGVVVSSMASINTAPTTENTISIGSLRASDDFVEFDDVNKGDKLVREIFITNPTAEYVEPAIMRLPPYLEAQIVPDRIAPNKSGVVRLMLNSNELHNYGLNQTNIYLGANATDKISDDKAIAVSAVLLPEHIAEDAPERINAPTISLSETEIDLSAETKKKVKKTIEINNSGKSTLEISSMQMFTQGLEVTLSKTSIAPGESAKLKITCNVEKLKAQRNRPRILMITNDPDNQKVVIDIKK